MWTLLQFAPRKDTRNIPPQNQMGVGSTVTQLVTKTLPIDVEKIRWADTGIATFLSKLLQEWVVNIALDEEELDTHSTLRVLSENDESWELTLEDLIDNMREKPMSMNHTDLSRYLADICWRVWVEILYDAYTPNITGTTILHIEKAELEVLLNAAVVGYIEWWIYHFAIRTDLDPESVSAFPEVFRDPRRVPLHLLAVEYLIGTLNDRNLVYSLDSQVQLMRYHDGVMYIIETTYGELYALVMDKIYTHNPGHIAMNNDRIAMQLFYKNSVIPLLR
jgi:hypothetical protein